MKEDGVVYVLLDEVSRDRHAEHSSATAEKPRPSHDQAELVGELRDQIEWLRREVERKDTIIMQMAQRIPELEPASEPREAPERAAEGTSREDLPPKPAESSERRSWLYRFFFGADLS
jgi:hypothetical protein